MRYYRQVVTAFGSVSSGLLDAAQTVAGLKASPVSFALLLSFIATFGPDHLCMLMVLSVDVSSSYDAFKVGCLWGFGHVIGMVIVCLLVIPLGVLAKNSVIVQYGDYGTGTLMACVGVFFLYNESRYVERKEDGEYTVHACSQCHGADLVQMHKPGDCNDCDDGHHGASVAAQTKATPEGGAAGGASASTAHGDDEGAWRRGTLGVIVGLVQGLLCPSCLVGAGVASQFGAIFHGVLETMLFVIVLVVTTCLLTGLLALVFSKMANLSSSTFRVSHVIVYRASAILLIVLGLLWITLTACGVVDVLEIHHHDQMVGDHSHDGLVGHS